MSTPIKNVAVAGASGDLGVPILRHLVSSGLFDVTVLHRSGSTASYPPGPKIVDVDYDSAESLTAALRGQDAVVSALGNAAVLAQVPLIEAAVAAGVRRFVPSSFGSDLANPLTRKLSVFAHKVQIEDLLAARAHASPDFTHTSVYNAAFLDWGLRRGFLLKLSDGKPLIIDGGDNVFTATTLDTVARAVVAVLLHPQETENRAVYVEDVKITQNRILELAKRLAPEREWFPVHARLDDLVAVADERLAKGLFDIETLTPYLFRACLDPAYGGNFEKTDNELLGLEGKTEEDVSEILKEILAE